MKLKKISVIVLLTLILFCGISTNLMAQSNIRMSLDAGIFVPFSYSSTYKFGGTTIDNSGDIEDPKVGGDFGFRAYYEFDFGLIGAKLGFMTDANETVVVDILFSYMFETDINNDLLFGFYGSAGLDLWLNVDSSERDLSDAPKGFGFDVGIIFGFHITDTIDLGIDTGVKMVSFYESGEVLGVDWSYGYSVFTIPIKVFAAIRF